MEHSDLTPEEQKKLPVIQKNFKLDQHTIELLKKIKERYPRLSPNYVVQSLLTSCLPEILVRAEASRYVKLDGIQVLL